jgi:hypothetical protein
MDIHGASTFFVGTILIGLGVIIIAMVILLLNNLFSKYWKPLKFSIYEFPQYSYMDPPMGVEPYANIANVVNTETTANTTIKVKNARR